MTLAFAGGKLVQRTAVGQKTILPLFLVLLVALGLAVILALGVSSLINLGASDSAPNAASARQEVQRAENSQGNGVSSPAGVQDGSWSETFNTRNGEVTVNYIETSTAKGRVVVWMELDDTRGGIDYYVKNISSEIIAVYHVRLSKNARGETVEFDDRTRYLEPGEKDSDGMPPLVRDATYFEFMVDVK